MDTNPVRRAIAIVGLQPLVQALGVSSQAMYKWIKSGRMPRTEWTGETAYSQKIEELTARQVTRDQLLGRWPEPASEPPALAKAA